jgi:hypothetical protein
MEKYHKTHVICHSCICTTTKNVIKYDSKNVTALNRTVAVSSSMDNGRLLMLEILWQRLEANIMSWPEPAYWLALQHQS